MVLLQQPWDCGDHERVPSYSAKNIGDKINAKFSQLSWYYVHWNTDVGVEKYANENMK